MIGSKPRVFTRLQLSCISITPGSDFDLSESVTPVAEAYSEMIDLNGGARNAARPVHRKWKVDISASDMRSAGLISVWPGQYVEAIPSEPVSVPVPGGGTIVSLPRRGIEVVGMTADFSIIHPVAQPATPLPLHVAETAERVASLRTRPSVSFAAPVVEVRYRPVLACIVTAWSYDADERAATVSWSLSLRER